MEIILAILLGGSFGYILQRIGATNPTRIIEMLTLTDLKLAKEILFAIGTATIIVFLYNAIFPGQAHFSVRAAYLGVFIGGLIFGLGFAIAGFCPGTAVAATGEGRKDAMVFVLGGLVGAYLFALSFDSLKYSILYKMAILGGKTTIAAGVTRHGYEYHHLVTFLPGTVTALILGLLFIYLAKQLPDRLR